MGVLLKISRPRLYGLYNVIFIQGRQLSLKCIPDMNKRNSREAKFFNKIVYGDSKKKRKFYFDEIPAPSHGGGLNLNKKYVGTKENSRRVSILNSVFMRHISDLLVTGNFINVLEKGLEITRVAMSSNITQLNVFWITNNSNNEELEAILPDLGFSLRHELCQLRVIGNVPRIVFVKDRQHDKAKQVDYLLSIADFGEDHVPAPYGSEFKNVPVENNDMKNVENSVDGEISVDEEPMPVMRQDTFNLDYDKIMNKILKKLNKSRALHRYQPNLAFDCEGMSEESKSKAAVADNMTLKERKDAMAKFILERKILQKKLRKVQNRSDTDILSDQAEEEYEYEDLDTEDYADEDIFEEQTYKN